MLPELELIGASPERDQRFRHCAKSPGAVAIWLVRAGCARRLQSRCFGDLGQALGLCLQQS